MNLSYILKGLETISNSSRKIESFIGTITSIALTKYSERIEIHAVRIESQIMDSHLVISGASSSSSALASVWISSPCFYTEFLHNIRSHEGEIAQTFGKRRSERERERENCYNGYHSSVAVSEQNNQTSLI